MLSLRVFLLVLSLVFLTPGEVFSRDYQGQILHSSYSPKQLELLRSWSYDKGKLLTMSKNSVVRALFISAKPSVVRNAIMARTIVLVPTTLGKHQLLDGAANAFAEGSFLDPIVLKRISQFEKFIDYYSRRYSIEPNLVKAIIYVESSGNLRSVSPKGAKGLMQLMPGTAAEVGVRSVFEPAENIAGGTKYLHQQLERFGHVHLALWAYNAGPRMVRKRILPLTTYYYILKVCLIKSMIDGEYREL